MDAPRERVRESLASAEQTTEEGLRAARELAETASERSRQALDATDQWVHENPWTALGIIGGIGLLAGVLIAQLTRSED